MGDQIMRASVDSIVHECDLAIQEGLGDKRLSDAARQCWSTLCLHGVRARVESGGDWLAERDAVLEQARRFGRVAAALSNSRLVLLWAVEAAATAVNAGQSDAAANRWFSCPA